MLLARAATSLYWAGRYLERAEMTARLVLTHGDTHIDLPVGEDVGWRPLLAVTGAEWAYEERYGSFRQMGWRPAATVTPTETQVVQFVLADRDNPSSVLASLGCARDNFRVARSTIPREAWEVCNELWIALVERGPSVRRRDGRVRWLKNLIEGCQRLNGILWSAMRRDEAMTFFRLGQQIERADVTCRILDVNAESAFARGETEPYPEVRRMAVLRCLDAYHPYRRTMAGRAESDSVPRFLFQDERFPRSVASCLAEVRDLLKDLPRNEHTLAACTDTSVLVATPSTWAGSTSALRTYCHTILASIGFLHADVVSTYFEFAAPPRAAASAEVDGAARRAPRASTSPGGPETMIDEVPESKIYRVTHRTTYSYAGPVERSSNEAHLTPRDTSFQRCLSRAIDIVPSPSSAVDFTDVFGNTVSAFSVEGRFRSMTVTATSDVAVRRRPAPSGSPPWEAVRKFLLTDRHPTTREARRYLPPSRLVPVAGVYEDYASASFAPGTPLVEAAADLTARLHRDFEYAPESTSVMTPLSTVMAHRRGVCQDFAHLQVACLRSLGLAARYVSGYIETEPPAGGPKLVGADASHAWASLFVPDWGWLDVDPTNDQLVGDRYVTTAWGRDYWDVSPLRGTLDGGGGSHDLDVSVDVKCLVPLAAG